MSFLNLTNDKGRRISINTDHIWVYKPYDGEAKHKDFNVSLVVAGETFFVIETIEEIERMLRTQNHKVTGWIKKEPLMPAVSDAIVGLRRDL